MAFRAGKQSQDPIHILIGGQSARRRGGDADPLLVPVGTGAVGAFYGSRLHQPSASPPVLVSLTCRSNYPVVSKDGISLTTRSFGDYHFSPHKVFRSVEQAGDRNQGAEEWDFVVVCTKALPDVTDDSETIRPVVEAVSADRQPAIVLIQNGVGVEAPHRKRFSSAPLVSAVTVVSAEQTKPGFVKQNRWTRITLGPYGGDGASGETERRGTEATQLLVELLKQGGIKDAESYDEKGLQLVRWHKIAIK